MLPLIRRLLSTWNRRDLLDIGALLGIIALMHIVGFATLIFVIAPHHYRAGTQIFGVGLGVTAYLFGLRHAFDADHIAAIDNTTRKLMTDGQRPKAVGFWFAMGHSSLVLVMAVLVMVGAKAAGTLADERSPTGSWLTSNPVTKVQLPTHFSSKRVGSCALGETTWKSDLRPRERR